MDYDVIVIGGGPAGVVSAVTAKKYYPDKSVLLIKSVAKGVIPCGIPYMFNTLDKPEDNAMGDKSLESNGIALKIGEVTDVLRPEKKVLVSSGPDSQAESFGYKKLILALGSVPRIFPIPGIEKKGIYAIRKELDYLLSLYKDVQEASDIVIVGGGFIGVEFADELSSMSGKKVTIVEALPEILANSFDKEFSLLAKEMLSKKGVSLITDKKVTSFNGGERVESLTLSDGSTLPCQLVILGMGASPNVSLAKKAGLNLGKSGAILVDEYLRTDSDKDIFAVGDCAEKKDFFTRERISVMLASTATAEARIAGANLFQIKAVRENKGTIACYSTKIGNLVLGSAGLTETEAEAEGFEISVGTADCVDRHPGSMPGASKLRVKLVFSRQSGILLGGQVAGGESAGEILNMLSLAIQKSSSLTELETLQVATHPKLTAAPTIYPVIMAAQQALGSCQIGGES